MNRQGDEPPDFWSQTFCWGSTELAEKDATSVRVRFKNTGGKRYVRPELHVAYEPTPADGTKVTFAWDDAGGAKTHEHVVPAGKGATWTVPTGKGTSTKWVEFEPVK